MKRGTMLHRTMTRKRHAIALTLVMTAALCADRVAVAAPHVRVQRSSVASRVMDRLTLSLRRVVPSVRVIETRREGSTVQIAIAPVESTPIQQRPISPFQFRMPPPLR